MGDDNEWIEEGNEGIGKFEEYFHQLFRTNGGRDWGNILKEIPRLVIDDMNQALIRNIYKEEVTEAVFQLGAYKAPGPNEFSGIFY